jgi:glycine cleavage system H protein
MSEIPDELRYTEDHVWARRGSGSDLARIGITDYAQDSLGDIVTVTLPAPGQAVVHGQAFGEIESTKSISDLISPFDGTVRAGNDALRDTPEIVKRRAVWTRMDPGSRSCPLHAGQPARGPFGRARLPHPGR